MPAALPYPAPAGWRADAQYFPTPLIWAAGGVAAAVGVASAVFTVADVLVWGVALAIAFGVLALIATAFGLFAVYRMPPQLINAVTLTRATERPIDHWVHFCRERPTRAWVRIWLTLSGLGTGVLLVLTMPGVLGGPGGLWWLFLFVPLLVPCLVLSLYGLVQLAFDVKNSTFGAAPVGLALGRRGVFRYLIAGMRWVPWEEISSVEALPHSRVSIGRRGGAEPLEFTAGVFEQDAVLLYCAVRFYVEHPELRDELGTTRAQQRFEQWHRAIGAPER